MSLVDRILYTHYSGLQLHFTPQRNSTGNNNAEYNVRESVGDVKMCTEGKVCKLTMCFSEDQ